MAKKKQIKGEGDCYYVAAQFTMGPLAPEKINYNGTPYIVHAEVRGQGAASGLRFGHGWVEDDIFVYDYSNNNKIKIPKSIYYAIGDIDTTNPKKYRKYTFQEARRKMVETRNYGCWDLDVEYKNGGEIKITQKSREFDADVFNELEDEENLSGFLVKDGNKEIGIVRVEENIYEKGVGYILGLEVFEKGKGYGKKIIEKIFQLHPTQHSFAGKATLTSKGFWLKLGAEFEDDYYFIIKKSKTKFTNGGNVLLAPNGQPSNLTPEQYRLVRTPEFKAWFGDWENDTANASKVVDSNGEPLVCYHGTEKGNIIEEFYKRGNAGIHFGTKKSAIERRVQTDFDFEEEYNLIPVFLCIKTPIKTNKDFNWEWEGMEFDDEDFNLEEDTENNLFESYMHQKGYNIYAENGLKSLEELLRENELDGVFYKNLIEDKGSVSYVVTEPTQIKLADGTNTTFDSNNPDIRYKTGGYTRLAKTPAPKSERIYGSNLNKQGSSSSKAKAKSIVLSQAVVDSIERKIKEHNDNYPKKKIPLSTAKAVVRRGMGAYSSTHRPTIKGGRPNSRVAWGLARLNAFIYKIQNGESKSGRYSQDNDLIKELGIKVSKFDDGGMNNQNENNMEKTIWLATAITEDNKIIFERFNRPITNEEFYKMAQEKGYTVKDSHIHKIENPDSLNEYKKVVSDYLMENYNTEPDWNNSLIQYSTIGGRMIVNEAVVMGKDGNEYNINTNDLFQMYKNGGSIGMKHSQYSEDTHARLKEIAQKHGCSLEDIMREFEMGRKMEMEHADTIKQIMQINMDIQQGADKIALDHIDEIKDYYTKLKEMENKQPTKAAAGMELRQFEFIMPLGYAEVDIYDAQDYVIEKLGLNPKTDIEIYVSADRKKESFFVRYEIDFELRDYGIKNYYIVVHDIYGDMNVEWVDKDDESNNQDIPFSLKEMGFNVKINTPDNCIPTGESNVQLNIDFKRREIELEFDTRGYADGGDLGMFADGGSFEDRELKSLGFNPETMTEMQKDIVLQPILAPENYYMDGEVSPAQAKKIWFSKLERSGLSQADIKKAKKIVMAEGGEMAADGMEIENQYEGKTPNEVWSMWTKEQRKHFVHDHADELRFLAYGEKEGMISPNEESLYEENDLNELPRYMKTAVEQHIEMGQYANGGGVSKPVRKSDVLKKVDEYRDYVLSEYYKSKAAIYNPNHRFDDDINAAISKLTTLDTGYEISKWPVHENDTTDKHITKLFSAVKRRLKENIGVEDADYLVKDTLARLNILTIAIFNNHPEAINYQNEIERMANSVPVMAKDGADTGDIEPNVYDWVNDNAHKLLNYYLPNIEYNEVFSQNELTNKGDYVIESEKAGDGSPEAFIEICFGEDYAENMTKVKENYDNYIKHAKDLTKGALPLSVSILSDDSKQSIMFLFTESGKGYRKHGGMNEFDYSKIKNVEMGGVEDNDFPAFSNAYIAFAEYNNIPMNDMQLDLLNEDKDFVIEKANEYYYESQMRMGEEYKKGGEPPENIKNVRWDKYTEGSKSVAAEGISTEQKVKAPKKSVITESFGDDWKDLTDEERMLYMGK